MKNNHRCEVSSRYRRLQFTVYYEIVCNWMCISADCLGIEINGQFANNMFEQLEENELFFQQMVFSVEASFRDTCVVNN